METRHRKIVLTGLFFALSVLTSPAQVQQSEPGRTTSRDNRPHANSKRSHAKPEQFAQTIRVGNADLPITGIVPRTESALSHLQETLAKAKDPVLRQLQQSLDELTSRIGKSRDETLYLVTNARSTEQLLEARLPWQRELRNLENVNSALQAQIGLLTGSEQQVSDIQQTWSAAAKSAREVALPEGLPERIQQVEERASAADTAVRSALGSLVQLQVKVSEDRKTIDEVLQEIKAAEEALHKGIFAQDSAPLWAALSRGSYASLKEQARTNFIAARSRTWSFCRSDSDKLLAYFVLLLVLTAAFLHLRASLRRQAGQRNLTAPGFLERPFSAAAFIVLFFFGFFFPGAPPEVFRISRFLLILPTLQIALAVFVRELHRPAITLGVFYALEILSSHMAAGTLLRRLLVLVLALAGLVGIGQLFRKKSPLRLLFDRLDWAVPRMFAYLAMICLAGSVIFNVVGFVSLADLLMRGTLRTICRAMVVYLMYEILFGLVDLLTATRVGQKSRLIRLHRELVLARASTVFKLAAWITWITSSLAAYQVLQETLSGLRSVLNHRWTIGSVALSLGDLASFFVVLIVASFCAKGLRFFLDEELLPRTSLKSGVAQATARLTHYALALPGFFLALAAAGVDLGRVTLLTGAFGVGMGFGLQNLVGNFVSGIILSLERPMQKGDLIEVGTLLGKVTKIGFRSSIVRTEDGAEVIVPNAELVTKPFVNWSLSDQLRRGELRVGVAYGTDPGRVLEIFARIIASHPQVLKDPQPLITFERFGESALEFALRFWTGVEQLDSVRSDLNVLVAEELRKNEISIPLPQRDVHLHVADTASGAAARLRDGSSPSKAEADTNSSLEKEEQTVGQSD